MIEAPKTFVKKKKRWAILSVHGRFTPVGFI